MKAWSYDVSLWVPGERTTTCGSATSSSALWIRAERRALKNGPILCSTASR